MLLTCQGLLDLRAFIFHFGRSLIHSVVLFINVLACPSHHFPLLLLSRLQRRHQQGFPHAPTDQRAVSDPLQCLERAVHFSQGFIERR